MKDTKSTAAGSRVDLSRYSEFASRDHIVVGIGTDEYGPYWSNLGQNIAPVSLESALKSRSWYKHEHPSWDVRIYRIEEVTSAADAGTAKIGSGHEFPRESTSAAGFIAFDAIATSVARLCEGMDREFGDHLLSNRHYQIMKAGESGWMVSEVLKVGLVAGALKGLSDTDYDYALVRAALIQRGYGAVTKNTR